MFAAILWIRNERSAICRQRRFGPLMRTLDCYIVGTYLVAVCILGIACRGRKQSVDEYFTAHGAFKGRLGTLVIGLSIGASYFSAISFIVYSSSAYSHGLKVLFSIITV